ncbi:hypothetical protein G7046_g2915 [Stylonectria norvegica]|nr:hypothetical protein G7046_g2915 [Stylonectria norvegica]
MQGESATRPSVGIPLGVGGLGILIREHGHDGAAQQRVEARPVEALMNDFGVGEHSSGSWPSSPLRRLGSCDLEEYVLGGLQSIQPGFLGDEDGGLKVDEVQLPMEVHDNHERGGEGNLPSCPTPREAPDARNLMTGATRMLCFAAACLPSSCTHTQCWAKSLETTDCIQWLVDLNSSGQRHLGNGTHWLRCGERVKQRTPQESTAHRDTQAARFMKRAKAAYDALALAPVPAIPVGDACCWGFSSLVFEVERSKPTWNKAKKGPPTSRFKPPACLAMDAMEINLHRRTVLHDNGALVAGASCHQPWPRNGQQPGEHLGPGRPGWTDWEVEGDDQLAACNKQLIDVHNRYLSPIDVWPTWTPSSPSSPSSGAREAGTSFGVCLAEGGCRRDTAVYPETRCWTTMEHVVGLQGLHV